MLAAGGTDWDFLADDLFLASEEMPDTPHGRLIGLPEGPPRRLGAVEFVRGNISDPRRPRRELGFLQPLMRRDFLERGRLTFDPRLRLGEDYVFLVQALLRGARFMLMPACGYVVVEHAGSLSHRQGAAELAALAAADERLVEEARMRLAEAVPALKAHQRRVQRELVYRVALDARRRMDWVAVAQCFLGSPVPPPIFLARPSAPR